MASRTYPPPQTPLPSGGIMHLAGHIRWTDLNFNGDKHYKRWLEYGQSKTANALMGVALAEELGHRGLLAFPICQGVSFTNLAAHGRADLAAVSADLIEMNN
ncbi:hypothetical protein HFD88_005947 [Aspergillus terreus]|nr:hypothetical protein HFD88_005947 [Aspergillus terreus]